MDVLAFAPCNPTLTAVLEDLVRVEVSRVVLDTDAEPQSVHLTEVGGERTFPIVIGFFEANEINRRLFERTSARPLTHELLVRVLSTVGWNLAKVVVTDLRETTFFAVLVLARQTDADAEQKFVDCRPSDAIALAVQVRAPIFVARKVFDAVAIG